jgi:hypothetical protein
VTTCRNGHDNPPGAKFCSECGGELVGEAEGARHLEPIVPAPPPPFATPPEGTPPRRPFYRRPLWLAIGGLILVLLVIAGLTAPEQVETTSAVTSSPSISSPSSSPTYSPSPIPSPVQVKIPKMIGMTLEEARAALQEAVNAAGGDASLSLETLKRYSSAPQGTVLASGPAAGVRVDSESTVRLTLAKSIPAVPNVVNLSGDKAKRDLEKLGYTVRTKFQESSAAKGVVLAQSVPAETRKIPERTVIVLTLARPPQGWFVHVEGSGSALVTWGNISGTSQQTVSLPWTAQVHRNGSFDVVTVVAQRQSGDSGSIVCEVIHSGRVVKRSVSSGGYAVCTASK